MFVQLPVELARSHRPARRHPRRDPGGQGGAQGARRRHPHHLGRARHAELLRQRRPALLAGCGWPTATGPSPTWSSPTCPGPDFPLYLGGAELEAGFPLGPVMDGMGVNITIMSYRGVLYWGIMASPDTIPRVWNLAAGIPLALDELLQPPGSRRPTADAADPCVPRHRGRRAVPRPPPGPTLGAARPVGGPAAVTGAGRRPWRGARAHRDGAAEGLGAGS